MANIIFGPGSSYSGGAALDVPGSPPLQASAGTVTTVIGTINQPIASVNTFSLVEYGISPYTYSISSGTLPTGVELNSSTGVVSGTPTATQTVSNVTFSVTDSLGVTSATTSTVAFTVNASITATANSISPVNINVNQSVGSFYPLLASGGSQPYWYFVSSGVLPDRVTLDPSTGLVTGTPTEPYSTANVTFSVRDAGGIVAATTSTVSFTVIAAFNVVASATTAVFGYQNSPIVSFNSFSSVSGGRTPYVYSIVSGTLPTGVALNPSTGLVSGTPTALQGASGVTFRVTDDQGTISPTTSTVSFSVNAALVATAGATSSVTATLNLAITSFNPFSSVTGGYTPYVYSVQSGTLPPGITINPSTGLVSGTPTATQGASSVTFRVTDNAGTQASTTRTVSFTVNAGVTIQYLVVGGGGGGGNSGGTSGQGGGGGAGGVVRGQILASPGTPFTIVVGNCTGRPGAAGITGNPSTLSAPIVTTITALGGGGGGSGAGSSTGGTGGSGGGGVGGGPGQQPTQNSGNPTVIQQYGNPGGGPLAPSWGSGGGGAVGVGGVGAPGAVNTGGTGYTWPLNGTTYATGGSNNPIVWSRTSPAPGAAPGTPGTIGRGNGGQSGSGGFNAGGQGGGGGGGAVLLALPTPNYPGVAPGAAVSTPGAAPGQTVLSYVIAGTWTFTI
jgi:hypothetical protein